MITPEYNKIVALHTVGVYTIASEGSYPYLPFMNIFTTKYTNFLGDV